MFNENLACFNYICYKIQNMSSLKVLLYKSNPKIDGTFPLVIRIIRNRKPIYYQIGYSIKPQNWNETEGTVKGNYPNKERLNHLILTKKAEVSAILMATDQENLELSDKQLMKKIRTNNKSSFKAISDEHLSDLLKLKKYNQHSGEKPRVNHFLSFIDMDDISFQQITPVLLKKFMIYLKADKELSDRSIMNCLIVIRTIFNKAINDTVVESKHYPFGPGKIQIKLIESRKVGLNESEIKKIEEIDLSKIPAQDNARNIWLTSFYLAGVRISDVIKLKWKDIDGGRLTYVMGKNNKVVSLKIPEKANTIFELYREKRMGNYVFPYLKDEYGKDEKILNAKTRSLNSVINKQLGLIAKGLKIDKTLTMHISRHSFGQIAGDKIAPQLLQKLYRHSDLKTTIGYQANFIHKDVDGALTDVLNF
jgi:integrase/recombinase XerD